MYKLHPRRFENYLKTPRSWHYVNASLRLSGFNQDDPGRKSSITASEIGNIYFCGYKSRPKFLGIKSGKEKDDPPNSFNQSAMDHGNKFEPVAKKKFLSIFANLTPCDHQLSYKARFRNQYGESLEMRATPDITGFHWPQGQTEPELFCTEIKCPWLASVSFGESYSDESQARQSLKNQHYLQLQYQMNVVQADLGFLVYYISRDESMAVWKVSRDRDLWTHMLDSCNQAWKEMRVGKREKFRSMPHESRFVDENCVNPSLDNHCKFLLNVP